MRLCRIVTVPGTFQAHLRDQLRCVVEEGIHLTLVASPGDELDVVGREVGAETIGVAMQRAPAPMADLRSLFLLTNVLQGGHFDIVHSTTPKAGFLTALASTMARVPVRIHTFTGQPWVELRGLRRWIPRQCDRITARLATRCYADSPSQREFLIRERLVKPDRIGVIGAGSISGVNLDRFSAAQGGERDVIRDELGISRDAVVVIFVGRVTKDKGIVELLAAFEMASKRFPQLRLLVVGPFEPDRDPLPDKTVAGLKNNRRIHLVGFQGQPERYLGAADIFVLPSYREGFGSVAIEAAALGLPAIVTRITGLTDAVVENVTGLIVPPKSPDALAEAIETLAGSRGMRQAMGEAGRQRVMKIFDARVINEAVVREYRRLAFLSQSGV